MTLHEDRVGKHTGSHTMADTSPLWSLQGATETLGEIRMEETTDADLRNIGNWLDGVTKPVRRLTMNLFGEVLSSQIWEKNASPVPRENKRGTIIITTKKYGKNTNPGTALDNSMVKDN